MVIRHRVAFAAAVVSITLVLVATLMPGGGPTPPPSACIICGSQGIADAICNLALFVPIGASLVAVGVRPWRAIAFAACLSMFVEGMQATIVVGRDATVGDVLFNTIGGALGVFAACTAPLWVVPSRRVSGLLAGLAAIAASAIVAITGFLVQPAFQATHWYAQWTAHFGNMESYRGHILEVRVGGRPVGSWRLDDNGALRESLIDGQPLVVRVSAGPLTRRTAPIFSVYDDLRQEQFLLGAVGTNLELYVRRRADDARVIYPPLRFDGVLRGVQFGDSLTLEVRREGVKWCAGRQSRVECLGYSSGIGWELLQDIGFLRTHSELMDALWLFGLLLPTGYWLRGRLGIVGGVLATVSVCAIVPIWCGLVISPPLEWTGAAAGVVVGNALAWWIRRQQPPYHGFH